MWLVVFTLLFLLVPFVAMQITTQVMWSGFDFLVMGALLLIVGSLLILIARNLSLGAFRWLSIIILITAVYVWVELAVGLFFSLGN
ncbi:MAG: hypothetical protein HWD83_01200 [Gammaproteobacteria bacterium]|nr:hypothetical protein [Gammaproteobacteria bacterium]